ncbi:cytochrome P450 306a1-like [Zophobas morio]|uniref:cytochrome P450 306a1-like n=1 Tax=Zophobas morio TaxID=2755281 RepID=UPI003082D319
MVNINSNMIVTLFVLTIILSVIFWKNVYHKKCLPGPWNLPVLGYLHKLNPAAPYLTLTELAKKYGPVYSIKLGFVNVVVIAEVKILKKVLAKNEALERPSLYMTNTTFENKGLGFTPIDLWKDQRKFVANFLRTVGAARVSPNKKECERLIRTQAEEFVQVVKSQACVPLNPLELLNNYVCGIASRLFLGTQFSMDSKTVADLAHNINTIIKLVAFGGPLNFLPFLRFLPKYKRSLTALKEAVSRVREIQKTLITECQKSVCNVNTNPPLGLIKAFLLEMSKGAPKHIYNLDQLHYLLFDTFIGFTETTISTLVWILLYLAQYDEVQTKIRQELVEVLQDKRAEMEDFVNLHYTKAAIAEVTRIRTVAPLGIPHCASDNICVENFTIPKGSMIMPLLWAIHMDPKVHKEPEEFRPERFLNDDGFFVKPESFLPFQSGKRVCIGEDIAQIMMSILIANVLKNFKIERPDSSPIDFTGVCGALLTPKAQKIIFKKL